MISYRAHGLDYRVYVDRKNVGTIKRICGDSRGIWQYFPKGSKVGGEPSQSIAAVKRSLEEK